MMRLLPCTVVLLLVVPQLTHFCPHHFGIAAPVASGQYTPESGIEQDPASHCAGHVQGSEPAAENTKVATGDHKEKECQCDVWPCDLAVLYQAPADPFRQYSEVSWMAKVSLFRQTEKRLTPHFLPWATAPPA